MSSIFEFEFRALALVLICLKLLSSSIFQFLTLFAPSLNNFERKKKEYITFQPLQQKEKERPKAFQGQYGRWHFLA